MPVSTTYDTAHYHIKGTLRRVGVNPGPPDFQVLYEGSGNITLFTTKNTNKNSRGWRSRLGKYDVGLGYTIERKTQHYGNDSASIVWQLGSSDPWYPGVGTLEWQGNMRSPDNPPVSSPATIDASAADAKAKSSAIQQIKDICNSFQGGTFLGELGETIRMIRHPAAALRQGIDSYFRTVTKRTRGLSIGRANKVVAGTWLEYQYGWKPLVSDIEDAAKTLARAGRHFRTNRFRATATSQSHSVALRTIQMPTTNFIHQWEMHSVNESRVTYFGAVSGRSTTKAPGLRQTWGFTTRDFLPTVWELIPYSFLVDYFTNIGEMIDALSYVTANLGWLGKTTKLTRRQFAAGLNFVSGPAPTISHSETGGNCTFEWFTMQRNMLEPSVSNLMPSLTFKLPGTSTRFLNIAALASQRSIRKR